MSTPSVRPTPTPPPAVTPNPALLTRADLRHMLRHYAAAGRTPMGVALRAAGLLGSGVSVVLPALALTFDWPFTMAIAVSAVVLLLGMAATLHAPRWRARQAAFPCPECGTNLVPGRAEQAIASGCCPGCGFALFAA